ncbi:alpha/beta fold hydrolase [Novosphingobium album (ex Liu et al. 2023)]|uniref:Alpha/beta hydrolase n=1 Tax=Novosphingobium album (ex Liu et al. 2023) TaxID=3031130 RepID=A0ABT5WTR3_9SPHN|nr:alpha/beta hydrolase [Novosphingobium album (ex Liu et al. 2023)]MDE8653277.1 alpha/beta hydrolase [Novosphingobium album (ex Liu et al. 2023)]
MPGAFAIDSDGARLVGEWILGEWLPGERRGEGDDARPLVLIHGFGGSRHDWAGVRNALPAGLPTLAYDQRGFGESTGPDGVAFSHAEDLLRLLDALGIATADICGMSLGGATALNFALNWPARVRRLVLVSPLMVGWSWTPEWVALWKAMGRAARAGDMATARELWWQHPLFAPTRESPAADTLRAAIAAFHGHQWIRDDQRNELPEIERLHRLAMPTLLLTGGRDLPDFRLMAEVIASAAPHVERIDHPDAGHMLTYERPREIAGEITRFLAD